MQIFSTCLNSAPRGKVVVFLVEVIVEAKFGQIFAYCGFIFIRVEEQRKYCLVFLVYFEP